MLMKANLLLLMTICTRPNVNFVLFIEQLWWPFMLSDVLEFGSNEQW